MTKILRTRTEREKILKDFDTSSLRVAYQVVHHLPLGGDVGGMTKDEMIRAILLTEYGVADESNLPLAAIPAPDTPAIILAERGGLALVDRRRLSD